MERGVTLVCRNLSYVRDILLFLFLDTHSFGNYRLFLQEHRVVHDTVLGRFIKWIFDDDPSDVALVLVLQQLLGANRLRVMDALSL